MAAILSRPQCVFKGVAVGYYTETATLSSVKYHNTTIALCPYIHPSGFFPMWRISNNFVSLLHAWYDIQFDMHNTFHEVRCLRTLFLRCVTYPVCFRDMALSIYLLSFNLVWMSPDQPCHWGEVPILLTETLNGLVILLMCFSWLYWIINALINITV